MNSGQNMWGSVTYSHWATLHLTKDWKVKGRDICWLETLAIKFLTTFSKTWACEMHTSSSTQTTRELLVLLIKAAAKTTILTSLYAIPTLSSPPFSLPLSFITSYLKLTWLTQSCMENWAPLKNSYPPISSSQRSSATVFPMSSLNPSFSLAAHAVKRKVGGATSLDPAPLHPTAPQTFSPFTSFSSQLTLPTPRTPLPPDPHSVAMTAPDPTFPSLPPPSSLLTILPLTRVIPAQKPQPGCNTVPSSL